MFRKPIVNNKSVDVKPNDTEQIAHNKYIGYSLEAFRHTITIYHDNAAAIPSTVNVFDFISNAVSKITLQIGAGNELYDLDLTAHMVRQLITRGQLLYTIDKTAGEGKVSNVELVVDFLSLGFVAPQDTILFNTGRYDHLLTQIVASGGNSIADVTVTKTNVRITEKYKTDITMPIVIGSDGKKVQMTPKNKKPIFRNHGFTSDNSMWEIDLPNNTAISKIIMYVTDGGKIVSSKINNIILKNTLRKLLEVDAKTLEYENRENLRSYFNSNYNGILTLDLSSGEYTQALVTSNQFKDTKLDLDVVVDGATNPMLNLIIETVEEA